MCVNNKQYVSSAYFVRGEFLSNLSGVKTTSNFEFFYGLEQLNNEGEEEMGVAMAMCGVMGSMSAFLASVCHQC